MNQAKIAELKYVSFINLMAMIAVAITLAAISIASLLQTISAFDNMADPSLPILGMLLPVAYGVLFQYGQNAALYIRQHYCDNRKIFAIGDAIVTSSNIAMGVFIVCAFVDGFTNVLWFYRSVEMTGDKFTDGLVMAIGYPSMVLVVFAEEVLGRVLQALRRVWREYKSIKERERVSGIIEEQRQAYQAPQQPAFRQTPLNVPGVRKGFTNPEPRYVDPNDPYA